MALATSSNLKSRNSPGPHESKNIFWIFYPYGFCAVIRKQKLEGKCFRLQMAQIHNLAKLKYHMKPDIFFYYIFNFLFNFYLTICSLHARWRESVPGCKWLWLRHKIYNLGIAPSSTNPKIFFAFFCLIQFLRSDLSKNRRASAAGCKWLLLRHRIYNPGTAQDRTNRKIFFEFFTHTVFAQWSENKNWRASASSCKWLKFLNWLKLSITRSQIYFVLYI